MKKFELVSSRVEISHKCRLEIKEGCSHHNDPDPEIIESFNTSEEALDALKGFKSSVRDFGRYYLVEEYYVEESDYDEDGEWIDGGDVWGFSEMPELDDF